MSSFIVEDKTINRIVSFCFWTHEDSLKYYIQRELKKVDIDLWSVQSDKETNKILKEFGKALLRLNLMAFYDRYKDSDNISDEIKQEIKTSMKEYKYFDVPLKEREKIQVLKSIECFLYQCSEGNIPEEPLFKALEQIKENIKDYIINEIPEYNQAIWG